MEIPCRGQISDVKLTKDESFDEGGKDGPHDFVGALLSSLGLQVHVEKVANPEE